MQRITRLHGCRNASAVHEYFAVMAMRVPCVNRVNGGHAGENRTTARRWRRHRVVGLGSDTRMEKYGHRRVMPRTSARAAP